MKLLIKVFNLYFNLVTSRVVARKKLHSSNLEDDLSLIN